VRYVSTINFVSGETVSKKNGERERKKVGWERREREREKVRVCVCVCVRERKGQRKWNEFCYHEKVCNKRKFIVIIIKKKKGY